MGGLPGKKRHPSDHRSRINTKNGEVNKMGETIYNLAFDFGASSGRMILSKYADGKILCKEINKW